MLVLSRKPNETIRIGDTICLRVISIEGGSVRLGIEAPMEISVHRGEVYDRIQRENLMAAQRPREGLHKLARALQQKKQANGGLPLAAEETPPS